MIKGLHDTHDSNAVKYNQVIKPIMRIKVQAINKGEKRKLQMYFAKATLGLQTRASAKS